MRKVGRCLPLPPPPTHIARPQFEQRSAQSLCSSREAEGREITTEKRPRALRAYKLPHETVRISDCPAPGNRPDEQSRSRSRGRCKAEKGDYTRKPYRTNRPEQPAAPPDAPQRRREVMFTLAHSLDAQRRASGASARGRLHAFVRLRDRSLTFSILAPRRRQPPRARGCVV